MTVKHRTSRSRDLVVFSFTGEYKYEDGYVYLICNEAPVVGIGTTEEEAYDDAKAATEVYIDDLRQRGEIAIAIKAGKLRRLVTVSPGSPVRVEERPSTSIDASLDEFFTAVPLSSGDKAHEPELVSA